MRLRGTKHDVDTQARGVHVVGGLRPVSTSSMARSTDVSLASRHRAYSRGRQERDWTDVSLVSRHRANSRGRQDRKIGSWERVQGSQNRKGVIRTWEAAMQNRQLMAKQ